MGFGWHGVECEVLLWLEHKRRMGDRLDDRHMSCTTSNALCICGSSPARSCSGFISTLRLGDTPLPSINLPSQVRYAATATPTMYPKPALNALPLNSRPAVFPPTIMLHF